MKPYETITVEVLVAAPPEAAWKAFVAPESVTQWNFAHESWVCPRAVNDLRVGGTFNYRMEARDGSFGFDYFGVYSRVDAPRALSFTLGELADDGRKVTVEFRPEGSGTRVVETFDAETENPLEQQRGGWQAILDNYRLHAEGLVGR